MPADRWWAGYRDVPDAVVIDLCPVCHCDVYDDPHGARNNETSPVRMPDRRHTHAGCEADYPRVVARLEAADGADPWPWDDDYLGTATSMQAEYEEQQHRRYA